MKRASKFAAQAIVSAVRTVRARRKAREAKPVMPLTEVALRQYGVRDNLRVDENVIREWTGGRETALKHIPNALVEVLDAGIDINDKELFDAAFKEALESAEARAIIESGLSRGSARATGRWADC